MSDNAWASIEQLRADLAGDTQFREVGLTRFPSGAAMLDVRGANRAFVLAYDPAHGFCVDELRHDDGLVPGYSLVTPDFASADRHLRQLINAQQGPGLSLLVLQSPNIERARDFYSLIGLAFKEEQHGAGPRHYAASLGALVFELYPCKNASPLTPLRVGFRVPRLQSAMDTLRSRGVRILSEPKDSPWGRRALVEDPDGNRVELIDA